MDLVRDATVRIHRPGAGYAADGPGQGFLGSGFFIAPSWVLTCAHVAMRGEGREVNVLFRADPYSAELTEVPGVVLAALPETRPAGVTGWPAPDLALIQLRRPVEHTCVYVTERSEAMLRGRKVRCVGWAPSPGGGLTTLSGDCEVKGTYGGWADADQQIRLDGDWLEPGMSGGPVVDVARGEVVGVIKSRLDDHQGGTAVGIERLRSLTVPAGPVETESDDTYQAVFHAHDRYHADRHNSPASTERTWADVQSDLPGPPGRVLSPKRRIDLLGRLAEFPPPVSTRNLLALLDGLPNVHARDLRPAPRGWRDGLGSLYDARVRDRDAALELVLRYCMGVLAADRPFDVPSTRTATKSLWEWVKRVADEDLSRDFRQELVLHWRAVRQRRDQEHQRAPAPMDEAGPLRRTRLRPAGAGAARLGTGPVRLADRRRPPHRGGPARCRGQPGHGARCPAGAARRPARRGVQAVRRTGQPRRAPGRGRTGAARPGRRQLAGDPRRPAARRRTPGGRPPYGSGATDR